jgi:alpha-L-rhamnosidase
MRETMQRISNVRRAKGMDVANDFLDGKHPLTIPADTTVSILLDQAFNTVAYPELVASKGKGSTVKLTYAEALFAKDGSKGNRNLINDKEIKGNFDIYLPDGSSSRHFRPLWFRTYRFIQLILQQAKNHW